MVLLMNLSIIHKTGTTAPILLQKYTYVSLYFYHFKDISGLMETLLCMKLNSGVPIRHLY